MNKKDIFKTNIKNKNNRRFPRTKTINRFWGLAKRLEFPNVKGKK